MGGSVKGLTAEQTKQLNAMLSATKAPPSSFEPLALKPVQQQGLTRLTALAQKQDLTKVQQARLTKITLEKKRIDAVNAANPINLGRVPSRTGATSLAMDARYDLMRRKGYKATVATSPLGDAGFGTSLSKPVLTGQAA